MRNNKDPRAREVPPLDLKAAFGPVLRDRTFWLLEALALVLLAMLFGYVSGDDPGPEPGNAFRFLISVLPTVFVALALLLSRWLPFEGRQAESDT